MTVSSMDLSSVESVGVDIGGTTITTGFFTSDWEEPVSIEEQSLEQFNRPGDWLATRLDQTPSLSEASWVIGVPSPVKNQSSVAETPNLPDAWADQAIPETFEQRGIGVQLENDANLAVLGEFHHGAGKDVENLLLLTLGTGIGGGIIVNNQLMRGETGAGAEVGHFVLEPGGRLCGCGNTGCFERYGSARGLEMTYQQLANDSLSAREIAERTEDDPLAEEAITQTGLYLGRGIANLVNLLEPGLILFAGGLSRSLDKLLPSIRQNRDANLFADRARDIPMERARLDNPALMGARILAETG